MADFQLDTSGSVGPVPGYPNSGPAEHGCKFVWRDLSPFQQGYVEAALIAANREVWGSDGAGDPLDIAFSDLAPETLAQMIADCERFQGMTPNPGSTWTEGHDGGECFWKDRLAGMWLDLFPPLTLTLGDDGKVYAKEAVR